MRLPHLLAVVWRPIVSSLPANLLLLCLLAFPGLVRAAVINVPAQYATVQAALSASTTVNGDTIVVAAGTYLHTGQLNVTKSVTIQGAGQDVTTLLRSGSVPGKETYAVYISAPNVTFANLTLGGWEVPTPVASHGFGYLAWNVAAHTTFENVHFHSDHNRVAIYFSDVDYLTVRNCRFTGEYVRGCIRGTSEFMEITGNKFETRHWEMGPINLEYGNALSGHIRYNYFANQAGFGGLGNFREDGSLLYAITCWGANVTADKLYIEHNTFDWQSRDEVNSNGNKPLGVGMFYDPTQPGGEGLVIRDNIFAGYRYAGNGSQPQWRPGQGRFGGALEFDGADDYATFQSALLDIGARGTLSLWVKIHDTGKRNMLLEGPGNAGLEFQFRNNGGGQFYGTPQESTNDWAIQNGGAGAVVGNWTNVQYTWDITQGKMWIYINGSEVGYLNGYDQNINNWAARGIVNTVNGLMYLGSDPGDQTRAFNGLMDDVVIFNQVLSQADRDAIRTDGVGPHADTLPGLVAYWNLDQSSGDVAPGSGPTTIPLQFPATTWTGYGVQVPSTALVANNLFFDNDIDATPAGDASNLHGQDPRFLRTGTDPEEYFALGLQSPALLAASDGTHIGAWQRGPAINHPPIADPQTVRTREETPVHITLTGRDPDGDPITFRVTVPPVHGRLFGMVPDLTYVPNANYSGTDEFIFITRDPTQASEPAKVSIEITPEDDPPTATPQTVTTDEDVPAIVTLSGSDPDGDALGFEVLSLPAHGVLTGTAPDLLYTPAANWSGADSFTFRVYDGTTWSSPAQEDISVRPVNDAPVAQSAVYTTSEDTPKTITLAATDAEHDPLTYAIVTPPAHGSLTVTPPGTAGGADYTYTPDRDWTGTDSFSFTANDSLLDSRAASVIIIVTPVNDPPVSGPLYVDAIAGVTRIIDVLAVVTDPDGDPLYVQAATPAAHGTTVITVGGKVSYTAQAGYIGTDQFQCTVEDAGGETATVTVIVLVSAPLSGVTLTFTPPGSQLCNQPVTATATATGGRQLLYFFRAGYLSNGAWLWPHQRGFSPAAGWTFSPTTPGTYTVVCTVLDLLGGQRVTVIRTYQVLSSFSGVDLRITPGSPQPANTLITLQAIPTGGLNLRYRFWTCHRDSSGVWHTQIIQDYSPLATCTWQPPDPGLYTVVVWAREATSRRSFDLYKARAFTVR